MISDGTGRYTQLSCTGTAQQHSQHVLSTSEGTASKQGNKEASADDCQSQLFNARPRPRPRKKERKANESNQVCAVSVWSLDGGVSVEWSGVEWSGGGCS